MSNVEQFEILVLGSGEAGKYLATMAKDGHRAALVGDGWAARAPSGLPAQQEPDLLVRVAWLTRRGGEFGFDMDALRVDVTRVQRRKSEMVEAFTRCTPSVSPQAVWSS